MIKQVKMFTIKCDGCGLDVNHNTEHSCWNDVSYLEDIRYEAGWEKIEEKHYCNDCFEYDDNDEIILLKK